MISRFFVGRAGAREIGGHPEAAGRALAKAQTQHVRTAGLVGASQGDGALRGRRPSTGRHRQVHVGQIDQIDRIPVQRRAHRGILRDDAGRQVDGALVSLIRHQRHRIAVGLARRHVLCSQRLLRREDEVGERRAAGQSIWIERLLELAGGEPAILHVQRLVVVETVVDDQPAPIVRIGLDEPVDVQHVSRDELATPVRVVLLHGVRVAKLVGVGHPRGEIEERGICSGGVRQGVLFHERQLFALGAALARVAGGETVRKKAVVGRVRVVAEIRIVDDQLVTLSDPVDQCSLEAVRDAGLDVADL